MSGNTDLPEKVAWPLALDRLLWNQDGLIPVTTVDAETGTVLMMAWVNREALELTLTDKRATYWSRSRQSLWVKGETSGNVQHINEVRADCDGDALLYVVTPAGPTCHTNRMSCFSWKLSREEGITCDRPVITDDES